MSWDGIVTEGAPVSLGWLYITPAFLTPVLCGENLSMSVLFEALPWAADIPDYHLCMADMFSYRVFPWKINSKWISKGTKSCWNWKGFIFPIVLSLVVDKNKFTMCRQGQEFTVSPDNVFNSLIIQTTLLIQESLKNKCCLHLCPYNH